MPHPAKVLSLSEADASANWRTSAYLTAASVLGLGIHVEDGEQSWPAITLVAVAAAIALAPLVIRRLTGPAWVLRTWRVPVALLAAQALVLLLGWPGGRLPWDNDLRAESAGLFRAGVAVMVLALGAAWVARRRARVACVGAALAVHLLLGVWFVRESPSPYIDTFVYQREAAAALRAGENPYAIRPRNIYPSGEPGQKVVYGEGMVRDGRVQFGYPYPPVSLAVEAASDTLTGDPRYGHAVCATLAAALLVAARPDRVGLLAAAVPMLTPRGFFVLGRSWTEAVVVLAIAWAAWAMRRRSRWEPVAVGVLVVVKQYMLPAGVFWATRRGFRGRGWGVAVAVATAAVIVLPFVVWDAGEFWQATVAAQAHAPYRPDGLTLLAAIKRASGWWLPAWLAVPAVLAAGWFAWRRGTRSRSGVMGAAAAVLLVGLLLSKHAFANYYYAVIGLLAAAAVLGPPGCTKRRARPL